MSKLNTKNYQDAVNEYYDLKQQYRVSKEKERQTFLETNEKMSWREKRNLFKSLNYKCVNCKRYVGSIFKINMIEQDRHLIAKCGDHSNPCPLNIDINLGTILSYEYALQIDKDIILDYKKDIIKEKNNLMFGYISSKIAIDRFDKLKAEMVSSIEIYEDVNKQYLNITNNLEKKEKLLELQQQVYGIINSIKIYIKQYESSNNPALINDAVTLYTQELIEKLKKLNMLNFAYKAVEYDADSNTYTLVEKQYSVEEMEINIGTDNKVISFVTGVGTDAATATTTATTDKTVTNKKKGRKTKAQIAEEEKAIDQLPDKFGPTAIPLKKTRAPRKPKVVTVKAVKTPKNKTVKKAVQFEIYEDLDSDSEKSIEITIPNPKIKENATPVTEVKDIDWGSGSDESVEIVVKGKGLEKEMEKEMEKEDENADLGAIELSSQVSDIDEDDLDFQNDELISQETEAEKIQNMPFE
jgi:hypothetical protein